jgi:hypothetical protein
MSQLVRLLLVCLTMLILPLQAQAMSRSAHAHDHSATQAHTAHPMPPEMQHVSHAHPAAQAQALANADRHCASGQAHCQDKAQTGADHGCGGAHCALCAALPHLAFRLPVIALNSELVPVTLTAGVAPPLDSLERPPQHRLA